MPRRETINISIQPELLAVLREDSNDLGLPISRYICKLLRLALRNLPKDKQARLRQVIELSLDLDKKL